eukprot:TRINITY_DN1933_c0_g1_i12.p1 TRINITY_DN1933_c0_g1~~TRINITY_DN1933_c0_g1_i12.p1  ORF type:complete len:198 (+),score=8.24 TRINITY_DN1933_c0_g1_i12:184-777(+)
MNILKLICHCCKRSSPPECMVPCKTPGCDLFFCHRCLTSRYKYSYAKTAKLPSPHWKCPVCTHKCRCADCPQPSSEVEMAGKLLVEDATCAHTQRRKKRIRKGKRRSSDCSLKTGSSMKTPSLERESQAADSPSPKLLLPPISSTLPLSPLVFLGSGNNERKVVRVERRQEILPASLYERMQIGELLQLVLFPIVRS